MTLGAASGLPSLWLLSGRHDCWSKRQIKAGKLSRGAGLGVCVYDRRGAGLIRNNLLVCGQWCCRDHYKQWRATRVRMWSRLMSGMGGVPQIHLTGRPNWRLNQLRGCTHGNDGETKWNTSASDCVPRSVWLVLLLSTCRLSRRTLCRKQTVQTEN